MRIQPSQSIRSFGAKTPQPREPATAPRPPPREESAENTAIVPFALPSWIRFPAAARGAVWRCVAPLGRRASLRSRNRSETCWGSPRRGSCGRLGFLRGLGARFSAFVFLLFFINLFFFLSEYKGCVHCDLLVLSSPSVEGRIGFWDFFFCGLLENFAGL